MWEQPDLFNQVLLEAISGDKEGDEPAVLDPNTSNIVSKDGEIARLSHELGLT
jgi:hypothetical protein